MDTRYIAKAYWHGPLLLELQRPCVREQQLVAEADRTDNGRATTQQWTKGYGIDILRHCICDKQLHLDDYETREKGKAQGIWRIEWV